MDNEDMKGKLNGSLIWQKQSSSRRDQDQQAGRELQIASQL